MPHLPKSQHYSKLMGQLQQLRWEQASLLLKKILPPLPYITPAISEKASENPLQFYNLTM